jgi:4'-phosphopantetheinyl transferase
MIRVPPGANRPPAPPRVSFHTWEDPTRSLRAAAGLGAEEIQVWIAAVPADGVEAAALARVLTPDELRRAARFIVEAPRRQFVFCRALVRHLAGACLAVAPETLDIGVLPLGKPFVRQPASPRALDFNLSHSGGLAAVALARGRQVGVDLELARPLDDMPALARRIFSPDELEALQALPAAEQREAFYTGWSRKEAYLKATGDGLTGGMREVGVSLAPGAAAPLLHATTGGETPPRWTLCDLPLPLGYVGSLAFENRRPIT